ncbi:MAG: hypothetical protein DMG57_31305, partial [Acidobacteria bacterium]
MYIRALWLALAVLGSTALGAQTRLDDYALILSDPPLAQQVSSSKDLHRGTSLDHAARLQAAQKQLSDELTLRSIRVTGSAQILVNAVFVRASADQAAALRSIPGVTRVTYMAPVHRKLDRALDLMDVPTAWNTLGGAGNAGAGVRIGVLDTGIDQNHPAFKDSSLQIPTGFPKGITAYTNHKVIVARSYVSMLPFAIVDPHDSRPDDTSPRDRSGHGTAVAMIAAGAQVTGPAATITGVAPKAYLGNYKIFGSPGVNDTTRTPVIIQALEDAISDGMDIVVLPVGDPAVYGPLDHDPSCAANPPQTQPFGIPSDACDIRAQAVENAVRLGLTVVLPAGNDGDTAVQFAALSSVETPGTAPSAITVGASTNSHIFYAGVIVPAVNAPTRRVHALFGDGPKPANPLTKKVRDVAQLDGTGTACGPLAANSLAESIALIARGDCAFLAKVQNAENAGAAGVIIVQSAGEEFPFTPTGLTLTAVPTVMIGHTDGVTLQNVVRTNPNQLITLDPTLDPVDAEFNTVAAFSSRGPALSTYASKPELVAVGTDLYTATQTYDPNGDLYDATGFTSTQGTSFSAAMVAGAAALVQQAFPNFTPAQIKSALVNTASADVIDRGAAAGITAVGAGKLDAGAAVTTPATIEPATISFGALDTATKFPLSLPLKVTNVTNGPLKFDLEIRPTNADTTAHVLASSISFALGAGQATNLTVQLQGGRPAPGSYEGFILIHVGGTTLRVPYLYLVSDGNVFNVLPLGGASFTGAQNEQDFFLIMKAVDRYGIAVPSVPVQFAVAVGDGAITAADGATDILGIAAAKASLGSQLGDQVFTGSLAGITVEFDGRARLQPSINSSGVVNAGSHQVGKGVAPGSYIEIYGAGLSEVTRVASTPYLPISLSGVSVSFDAPGLSLPGHIYFVMPGQVDVQVPWEFQGLDSVSMKVIVGETQSAVYTVPLNDYSPATFLISDTKGGQVIAALDRTNRIVSSANPALRGQAISLYVNGLGPVDHTP